MSFRLEELSVRGSQRSFSISIGWQRYLDDQNLSIQAVGKAKVRLTLSCFPFSIAFAPSVYMPPHPTTSVVSC